MQRFGYPVEIAYNRSMRNKLVFLFLILALLTGCTAPDPAGTPTPATVHYLALGDSYTIGEGVAESARYPVQLGDQLSAEGYTVTVEIIARTGWTTADLQRGIDSRNPQGAYELVTLLIGVNNQFRQRSLDEYQTEFRQLLLRAIGYAGGDAGRVIVLSIPDYGVTPFAAGLRRELIAAEIDSFNAVNRQESEALGARYVDITPISRRAGSDLSLLAADGLHPSGKMYAEWVDLLLPVAIAALGGLSQ